MGKVKTALLNKKTNSKTELPIDANFFDPIILMLEWKVYLSNAKENLKTQETLYAQEKANLLNHMQNPTLENQNFNFSFLPPFELPSLNQLELPSLNQSELPPLNQPELPSFNESFETYNSEPEIENNYIIRIPQIPKDLEKYEFNYLDEMENNLKSLLSEVQNHKKNNVRKTLLRQMEYENERKTLLKKYKKI